MLYRLAVRHDQVAEPETGLITDEALTMAARTENSDAALTQQFAVGADLAAPATGARWRRSRSPSPTPAVGAG